MKTKKLLITNYWFLGLALVLVLTGWHYQTVSAQDSTPTDDDVNAIAKQLYCPVCENTPLDVCPTEACRQWRELIRQMLAEGKTEQEIKDYFVANYGARVLSEPPRAGFNWLWIGSLTFLIGLIFAAWPDKDPADEPVRRKVSAGDRQTSAAD